MNISSVAIQNIARLVRWNEDPLAKAIVAELLKGGACAECLVDSAQHDDTRCSECRDEHIRFERSDAGMCIECGKNPTREELSKCPACRAGDYDEDARWDREVA